MRLGVREVAHLFEVAESTVYRWIQEDALPASEVEGGYWFHRAEVLEWATTHDLTPTPELFEELSIARALERGGVHLGLVATDRASALDVAVACLPLPDGERALVRAVLEARQGLGRASAGGGIALPHVRHPIVCDVPEAILAMCAFSRAVDLDVLAPPVRTLFLLVTPSARAHLTALSWLAFLLRDPPLIAALEAGAAEEVLAAFAASEARLHTSLPAPMGGTP